MAYRNTFVDIPLGLGGLDGNRNYYQIPPSRLVVASNIIYDSDSIVKAPGFNPLDSDGVGDYTLFGGFDYRPTSSLQYQITAWSNGDIYRSFSANLDATTLKSGLSFTDPVHFIRGGFTSVGGQHSLYMFSKNIKPQQLNGSATTFSDLSGESLDWGSFYPGAALYHDARIYAYDLDDAPHNFYISSLNDHGDFSLDAGGRVFSIAPGDGDRISAMISANPKGLSNDTTTTMYAFKFPYGLYAVDTTDVTGYGMPAKKIREDVGCAGSKACIKVGNDIFFVSSNGRLYSLATLFNSPSTVDADVTEAFNLSDYLEQNLDRTRLDWITLSYDEKEKTLYYFFTSFSSPNGENDKALVFKFGSETGTKVSIYEQGEYFNHCWAYRTGQGDYGLLVGGQGGKVYTMDSDNRNIDGEDFVSEIALPATDFRWVNSKLQGTRKRFDMIELTVVPTGSYDIQAKFTVDGDGSITRNINLGSNGSDFAEFFTDETPKFDTATFGGQTVIKRRVPINCWGETLQISFRHEGLNESFQLINIRLYFKAAGELYESA